MRNIVTDPLTDYLVVGALLFVLGALGFLTRRSLILMMLSAELMLHGVSLNLVAFSTTHRNYQGQAFTAFVLTVAACEAALALALILVLYRRRKTLDVRAWTDLNESPASSKAPPPEDRLAAQAEPEPKFPRLTPTGHVPVIGDEEIREAEDEVKDESGNGQPPHSPEPAQETPSHV